MEKLDNCNELDQLYTDLCNSLRKTGKASNFCQLINNSTSDLDRIVILNKDCNIVPSLVKIIRVLEKNKDPQQARKLLTMYHSKNNECSLSTSETSENSIRLLNSALVHLHVYEKIDFQQFNNLVESDGIAAIENLLIECDGDEAAGELLLLSDVYRERANCFSNLGDHKMVIVESIRSIRYAKFNKNDPHEHLFLLLFRISSSLRHLHQLQAAKNVIQFSIKLLRSSQLDNTIKSVETIKLVKLLKDIQIQTNDGVEEHRDSRLDLDLCLQPQSKSLPKIFDSVSDTLTSSSSSLQLKWDKERGRHLIAKETIPAGSTLIIEDPFSWIVHPIHRHTFCQNCCQLVKNVITCRKCTDVVFCSEHCRRSSKVYHQYECGLMKMLTSSETLGDMALLCYRTISKIDCQLLVSHIREFFQLSESRENEQVFHEKFGLGLNTQLKLDSSDYSSVFAQTPNTNARQGGDLLKRSFSAIALTICLRQKGYFEKDIETDSDSCLDETEELIAALFLRHLQSTSCNAYGINEIRGVDHRRLQVNEIGGATYPIISTTNHSCNSNAYRFSVGKTCVVNTLREIRCGEEILDSYGPDFASNPIDERKRLLEGQYLFSCSCSCCTENWQLYSQLPRENQCLKCSKCANGISTQKKDRFICSQCSNVLDVKKLMKTAAECAKRYQCAKELLLAPNKDSKIDYKAIHTSIVAYANILGSTQKWPCQVLIECQETLKLCWNLQYCQAE